jgi:hypothetical protein
MKTKKFEKTLKSSPDSPIENEVGDFNVTISSRVLENRKQKYDSQILGEYLTVNYNVTLSRKVRRVLLQTVLDSVMRKKVLFLNLGEYIVIEDLVFRILTQDQIEQKQHEKYRVHVEQMLGFALLVLHIVPVRTRYEIMNNEGHETLRQLLNLVLKKCSDFSISDSRTYESRRSYYNLKKFIEFSVQVPLIDSESRNSIPYSSYTKGYGESHMKKTQTPIDWEIDGEDIWEFTNSQEYQPVDLIQTFRELESEYTPSELKEMK